MCVGFSNFSHAFGSKLGTTASMSLMNNGPKRNNNQGRWERKTKDHEFRGVKGKEGEKERERKRER